jgi:hypothetical protein
MPVIFISYRRSDSQDVTGRIYDRLLNTFTRNQVFKDVDSIPLGVSFPAHIQEILGKSSVVLVVIGPTWLATTDGQGKRRLDDPSDFVRLEVELALRAEIPVIPVLVSGARMPPASELPESLKGLADRNGMQVRADPDFNHDMTRLFSGIDHLEKLLLVRFSNPALPIPIEIVNAELAALPPALNATTPRGCLPWITLLAVWLALSVPGCLIYFFVMSPEALYATAVAALVLPVGYWLITRRKLGLFRRRQ